jgi:hypothetical protein
VAERPPTGPPARETPIPDGVFAIPIALLVVRHPLELLDQPGAAAPCHFIYLVHRHAGLRRVDRVLAAARRRAADFDEPGPSMQGAETTNVSSDSASRS